MKVSLECYDCLGRLICQAARLATSDEPLRQKAVEKARDVLNQEFSGEQISIAIATKLHKVIREITGNPDPYRIVKEDELRVAGELFSNVKVQYKNTINDCIKLATVANAIDFFRSLDAVAEDMQRPVKFTIDDSQQFEAKLKKASKVLYLADNVGEIYFDLPLVKRMRQLVDVKYVVKPLPVQNDATVEDVKEAGLEGEFGVVITTGVASPGVILDWASEQFREEFEAADLVFAKGMGHYESLSELPGQGKVFYCLMAKCRPVANSLGVPLNSYVAMLR
ncbi:MAG: hypothetical protein COY46_02655 [Chloroflexi bacterium CG_4_10_14_0_8_um_filter_46_9]|nr:MAG: hypothetical protein COY46_02655 [Chloroflexi bacterium CG_4_10_14_0_8_um_filter_46_9]